MIRVVLVGLCIVTPVHLLPLVTELILIKELEVRLQLFYLTLGFLTLPYFLTKLRG